MEAWSENAAGSLSRGIPSKNWTSRRVPLSPFRKNGRYPERHSRFLCCRFECRTCSSVEECGSRHTARSANEWPTIEDCLHCGQASKDCEAVGCSSGALRSPVFLGARFGVVPILMRRSGRDLKEMSRSYL